MAYESLLLTIHTLNKTLINRMTMEDDANFLFKNKWCAQLKYFRVLI